MKISIKYLAAVIVTVVLSFSINSLSFAQHRGGGGGGSRGGGGSFHGGGGFSGGGFHSGGSFHSSPSFGGNRGSFQSQRPANVQSQPRVNSNPRTNTQSYSSQRGTQSYNGVPRASANPNYAYRGGARGYNDSAGAYYNNRGGYRGGYFRGGYRYYGGYYSRFYAPRLGLRISVLPYGYYPFYWGDYQYYYNDGLFYQQYDNTQYEVVAPPMGAIVPTVPNDAKSITIDGVQYYEANGVYYLPVTTSDGTTGYKIVGKDGELNTGQNNDGAYPQDDNSTN